MSHQRAHYIDINSITIVSFGVYHPLYELQMRVTCFTDYGGVYFKFYDHPSTHKEMLEDYVLTEAYKCAIAQH